MEGKKVTAVSFNNMSEYMKNFDLTKRIEKLEKERDTLYRLIKNHYADTTTFIDQEWYMDQEAGKSSQE